MHIKYKNDVWMEYFEIFAQTILSMAMFTFTEIILISDIQFNYKL